MIKTLHRLGWLVVLVLLQALILNHVHIAGYATPFLYVYLLLKMDSNTTRIEQMLWAFALGLLVDIFSDTPGMNAGASVLMAFVRTSLLNYYMTHDTVETITPGMISMGRAPFLKYITTCVLIHHLALMTLEYLSFAHIGAIVGRAALSTIVTLVCITALEYARRRP